MSSFSKNLIPRRIHKERAQLLSRSKKHGLLQKHTDYKTRATDRNRKALRLKLLKEKATFRNRDEFHHGMLTAPTANGRVIRTKNNSEQGRLPLEQRDAETRLLLESRDAGYISLKAGVERGKITTLQKSLHFLTAAAFAPRTHIIFADDEAAAAAIDSARAADTAVVPGGVRSARTHRKLRNRAYKQLALRAERGSKLATVDADLAAGRALLAKGRRDLVRRADESGAPAVYKWRLERKR